AATECRRDVAGAELRAGPVQALVSQRQYRTAAWQFEMNLDLPAEPDGWLMWPSGFLQIRRYGGRPARRRAYTRAQPGGKFSNFLAVAYEPLFGSFGGLSTFAEEDLPHQQQRANHNRAIGHIEGRPVVTRNREIEEINHAART